MTKKAKILGLDGKEINPDPPAGLYAAANCPICNSPIFYHGGGEHTQHNIAGPTTYHQIPEAVFQVCDCPKSDIALEIPDEYNLVAERQALIFLFTAIHQFQATTRGLVEQLEEAMQELGYASQLDSDELHSSCKELGHNVGDVSEG